MNAVGQSSSSSSVSLAKRLWDVDWQLPWTFEDVTVREGKFTEAVPFIREHYASIFDQGPHARFFVEPMNEAKRRFGDEMDVFLFESQQRLVGLFMGNASDWSTYYLRTTAILPDYRRKNLFGQLLARLHEPLRAAGVARLEAECSPTNAAILSILASQDFIVTATAASERWGLVSRLTKFLQPEPERTFNERFCQMQISKRSK